MNVNIEISDTILKFQEFVGQDTNVLKYLHNTRIEEIAKIILNEGFRFEKYLENTADLVSGLQAIELKYFLHLRRSYGDFTVVMNIGKDVVEKYSEKLKGTNYHYTEALSKNHPELSNDDEYIYTLPEQFIKGYFNQKSLQAHYNPKFDPHFDCKLFEENTNILLSTPES